MPDYTDPTEPGFTPPSQTQNEQFLNTLTGGALRIDADNNIQIRVVASAGTPDDGGATLSYGASNALGHGMAQIRIDGVNAVMDININGDVYTTSLGTGAVVNGLPAGGQPGEALIKTSPADFDADWQPQEISWATNDW